MLTMVKSGSGILAFRSQFATIKILLFFTAQWGTEEFSNDATQVNISLEARICTDWES